jgi:hypothetical protein
MSQQKAILESQVGDVVLRLRAVIYVAPGQQVFPDVYLPKDGYWELYKFVAL